MLNINVDMKTEVDLSTFTTFGQTGALTKREPPEAKKCQTLAQLLLACEGLFTACCNI